MGEIIDQRFLGDCLRRKRQKKSLTLRQVSEATGISIATLSRIERGKSQEIEASTLMRLTEWLEIPIQSVRKSPTTPPTTGKHKAGQSVPDIVELHLRADKKLGKRTATALANMFRAAYEELSQEEE